ncbi:MAG: DsbA family protein [Solirubrobacteraceae bacterium]|nr:DsbA family protein [Solirubrobacteraceae bacterium]
MASISIEHFTDPNCPFAYSAEPIRRRLQWVYGDQIAWRTRMVVLSESRADYEAKGLTNEMVQTGYERLSKDPGMPFDTALRSHLAATAPACAAVVAAREKAGEDAAQRVLRALRLTQMTTTTVIDEPDAIDAAITKAGLDPATVAGWITEPGIQAALAADKDAARHPLPAAAALDRRLANWEGGRRYTCPTYVLGDEDGPSAVIPGFNPIEVYEVVLANCGPALAQRPDPETVNEILTWAGEPLATAEVAAVAGVDRETARERLIGEDAVEHPSGTDAFWTELTRA